MRIYNFDTIFNFGMHKGKTLKQVLGFTGSEKFDYPELKNKPKPEPRKPGDKKHRLSTPEELKHFFQGITMNTSPDGVKYINWCIINREKFFITKETISEIKKKYSNFHLSKEANEYLEEKHEEWIDEKVWNQNNHFDSDEYLHEDEQYCGACMESPCLCSDPEKTSTLY
jgi:hypothetical protein